MRVCVEYKLKILDLFSGIGGFSYAAEKLVGGFETIAFCEQDEFCKKVLNKHWEDVPIYEDVRRLDGKKIKADVVVGGFPCQAVSTSGKRRGTEDDRWLWDEMFRIIQTTKPKWIIGENVPGLISIDEGFLFGQVLSDLESQNYDVQSFIIPACSQNAPHRRDRIWIVAHSDNPRYCTPKYDYKREREKRANEWQNHPQFEFGRQSNDADVADTQCLGWTEGSEIRQAHRGERWTDNSCNSSSSERKKENVHNSKCRSGETQLQWKQELLREENTERQTNRSCNRDLQRGGDRTTKSRMGNVVDGLPQRLFEHFGEEPPEIPRVASNQKDRAKKLKALGNSIVPQVAAEIFKAILIAERT